MKYILLKFKIKIILYYNIFHLKKLKFFLLTIFMIKIFKLYKYFFILCYLI